jgi:beta-lactamase regulating signal transducer with metallopeptidase domain
MATELVLAIARTNLAAGAAMLLVLALRAPMRRRFGAQLAYALWLIPVAAAAGALTPGAVPVGWAADADDAGRTWLTDAGRADLLVWLWLAGGAASVGLAVWRQLRFAAEARAGRAGPAVIGVRHLRLVTPADLAERFTEAQRGLIRAHERAHMDRGDSRANALAVCAAWLCWFNPLAHLALAAFRCDQELACDATVMTRLPGARRAYAETLLRSDPHAGAAVFGCHWVLREHPLATRIAALAGRTPRAGGELGLVMLAGLVGASFACAWAAQSAPSTAVGPSVISMQLAPASAEETAWVYRSAPR